MNFTLNTSAWLSLGKGALMAAAGAGLTYALAHVTDLEFGSMTPVLVAALSVLANYVHKVATE
jgi:hypothetical protein